MSQPKTSLEQIFENHIQTLALTLRRRTVTEYRGVARHFLGYLRATFPRVRRLSQLRRDPHLLAWLRRLCEQPPRLCNKTRQNRLLCLRRLLDDLAAHGHPIQPGLILREDFPPHPRYLPRPLSPEDDQLLQQELRRTDDLTAHALLLTRATGIRIGECIDLAMDCLRQVGPEQWALHVPIGKLHTERLVPADVEHDPQDELVHAHDLSHSPDRNRFLHQRLEAEFLQHGGYRHQAAVGGQIPAAEIIWRGSIDFMALRENL